MGTHIECYFPSEVVWTPATLASRLNDIGTELKSRFDAVERELHGPRLLGGWRVFGNEAEMDTSSSISGEGPARLDIEIFRKVICLSCAKTFSALYDERFNLAPSLPRLLFSVITSLARPANVAIAAGGLGDTDAAWDIALDGGSFDEVARQLRLVVGDPAQDWKSVRQAGWYLGPPPQAIGGLAVASVK